MSVSNQLANERAMKQCYRMLNNPIWGLMDDWRNVSYDADETLWLNASIIAFIAVDIKREILEYPVERLTKWEGEKIKLLRLQLTLLEFVRDTELFIQAEDGDLKWINRAYRLNLKAEELEAFLASRKLDLQNRDNSEAWEMAIRVLRCRDDVPALLASLKLLTQEGKLTDAILDATARQATRTMSRLSPSDVDEIDQVRAMLRGVGLEAPAPGLP